MVDIIDRSIVTAPELFIAIDVNTLGYVSKKYMEPLFSQYPNALAEYKNRTRSNQAKLGDALFTYDNNKIIICLFTQYSIGYDDNVRHISYDALEMALNHIVPDIDLIGYGLALPYDFGVADGGGNRFIIRCILSAKLTDVNISMYK